jgi:tRNA(fMet)-specific endonuclease VapC
MIYLLDTNVCIHLLNDRHTYIERRMQQHNPSDIALCSVVKAELLYGARHSQRVDQNLQKLAAFFAPLQSLPFDDACAHQYGIVRAELLRQGKPIGANDMLIAAIALRHDATLITNNTNEFERVPGLRIDDWQVS